MSLRLRSLSFACLFVAASAFAQAADFTLAFGSCLRQWSTQPVWQGVLATAPNVFVFAGDNVYTDIGRYAAEPEPERIGRAYAELARDPGFAALRARLPIHATWDDHDYGRNDAGAEYPHKEASKRYFMEFFDIASDSAMRSRAGTYDAHWFSHGARRIQLLLLDTRSFRSEPVRAEPDAACPRIRYGRNAAPDATVLGAQQWQWLESRLMEPADFHVLVSSIQVIPEQHCFEKWANFPLERERLLRLLARASAPALIASGDRHMAEISKLPLPGAGEALLEITSSGMNSAGAGKGETNRFRALPDNVRDDNFATISIGWREGGADVELAIRDVDGAVLQRLQVRLPQGAPAAQTQGGPAAQTQLPR